MLPYSLKRLRKNGGKTDQVSRLQRNNIQKQRWKLLNELRAKAEKLWQRWNRFI